MTGKKAIDRNFPDRRGRKAEELEPDEDDEDWPPRQGQDAAQESARATYEPGEADDWAQDARGAWRPAS